MVKTVLLVDDDKTLRRMFGMRLRLGGFDVCEASSSKDALMLLAQRKFDVSFIDVMLGEVSGFSMLSEVESSDLRDKLGNVIMMTSLDRDLLQDKLDRYEIAVCLDKSELNPSDLVEMLAKL